MEVDSKIHYMGSQEIAFGDNDGIRFVAPDLLYHYIRDHFYAPPKEFVEFVTKAEWVAVDSLKEFA